MESELPKIGLRRMVASQESVAGDRSEETIIMRPYGSLREAPTKIKPYSFGHCPNRGLIWVLAVLQ